MTVAKGPKDCRVPLEATEAWDGLCLSTSPVNTSMLDFQPQDWGRINSCCLSRLSVVLLWQNLGHSS